MSELRGTKRNNSGVTDPKKASLTQNLSSLDDSAAKVSDMAGLWSAVGSNGTTTMQSADWIQLNMDLHKISSWLSLKLEGGEVQGSWEVRAVSTMMKVMTYPNVASGRERQHHARLHSRSHPASSRLLNEQVMIQQLQLIVDE
jgi:hypothetical protein